MTKKEALKIAMNALLDTEGKLITEAARLRKLIREAAEDRMESLERHYKTQLGGVTEERLALAAAVAIFRTELTQEK